MPLSILRFVGITVMALSGAPARANPFFGALITCRGQCLLIDAKARRVESLGGVKGTSEDLPLEAFVNMGGACDKRMQGRLGPGQRSFLAHDIVHYKTTGGDRSPGPPPLPAEAQSWSGLRVSSFEGKFEFAFQNQVDLGGVISFENVTVTGALARAFWGSASSADRSAEDSIAVSSEVSAVISQLRVPMAKFTDCALEYPEGF